MHAYNSKDRIVYCIPTRVGSTTLSKICDSAEFSFITDISYDQFCFIINEDVGIRIVTTIRHPVNRFRSGLKVASMQLGWLDADRATLASKRTRLFFKCTNALSTYGIYPYHLFNSHLNHVLLPVTIAAANGYNVEFIHLDNFSEHLSRYYPNWESIEGMRFCNGSLSPPQSDIWQDNYVPLIRPAVKQPPSWDEWMAPEMALYDHICNRPNNAKTLSHYMAKGANEFLCSDIMIKYSAINDMFAYEPYYGKPSHRNIDFPIQIQTEKVESFWKEDAGV
jgi:hypothetical protein